MDYLIVYDKFETAFSSLGLAVLENASSVKIKEVINGEFLLSFILPRNGPKWQHIQSENFVKVYDCSQKKDQYFRIRGFDEQRDSTGKLTSNVQCEHAYYDAHDCKFFPNVELIGQTPTQILTYAFSGTRFTVGTVDITTTTDIILDKVYPSEIVAKLVENVGGELVKDNWTISLVTKRGSNTGVQLRYGKNQATLKKSTDAKSVITRLYPYGKDGLQIAGSLGYIDSPLIGNYDRPKIGHLDYSDIEDQTELLTAALKEWSNDAQDGIDKPRVTYSGEFIELKKLKEYGELEAYGIGDVVRVIDEGLGVDTTQRILEYECYHYEPKRSIVSLSNTKPSVYKDNRPSNIIGSTISTSNYVSSITDASNKLDPSWFQNIKSKLKTLFNGGIKDAVMHKTGDIWVDNSDNPTKAMGILADGFAIANSKLTNGDWDWKTFGTADGFFADLITAGILRGIQIQQISDVGKLLMEVFKDNYGGVIKIYDNGELLDVKIGVESGTGSNEGGTLILYKDSPYKNAPDSDPYKRIEIGIRKDYGSGIANFRDGDSKARVSIEADSNIGSYIGVRNAAEVLVSYLAETFGKINGEFIATQTWVTTLVNSAISTIENWAAEKGVSTGSSSHSHSVTIDGQTYTTSSSSHSHTQA